MKRALLKIRISRTFLGGGTPKATRTALASLFRSATRRVARMLADFRPLTTSQVRGALTLPFGTVRAPHPRVRHPKSKKRSGSNRRPSPPTSQAKLYGIWSRNELYRTSRPKNAEAFGKLVSVPNNDLQFKRKPLLARKQRQVLRAGLHDVQIVATMSFATHARYFCGFRNFMETCMFLFFLARQH